MDTYVYQIGSSLYVNLTNRCSNHCLFCVREQSPEYQGYSLWLKEGEPTAEQIIQSIGNPSAYREIVFCGYGEPTYNLDTLDEVASYLHCIDKTTRINTNGQANLIHGQDVTDVIVTSCDVINVSLNECTAAKYQQHCKSKFGEKAYDALIEFAKLCKQRGGNVVFSVVDSIGEADVAECKKLAEKLGIPLRIRIKK